MEKSPSRTNPKHFCHQRHIPSCLFATPEISPPDLSGVAKLQEGICLGWKKDRRGYVLGVGVVHDSHVF